MRQSTSDKPSLAEEIRSLRVGNWQVALLPRAPYEASYSPTQSIIGFSFDVQIGTHAFASDKKKAFRSVPNGLAYVPAGCDVYSQSVTGGEYLKLVCCEAKKRPWEREQRFSDLIGGDAFKQPTH